MSLIRERTKASPLVGFFIALGFGALLLPISTFDLWVDETLPSPGQPARVTLRTPDLALFHHTSARLEYEHRAVLVPRGQRIDDSDTRLLLNEYFKGRRPPGLALLCGLGLAYFLAGLLFNGYLRNFGYRGNLLRTQLGLSGALVAFVALAKALLVFTPFSATCIPISLLAIPIALHLDRQVALAVGVTGALLAGTLIPFDLTLSTVLLVQAFACVMLTRTAALKRRTMIGGGFIGGIVAAGTYLAIDFLLSGRLPIDELESVTESNLWGCVLGGLGGGLVAYLSHDAITVLLGNIPRTRLYELAELENPLLKRIAENAPGTWAHSLAVANLAEIAANSISANALLTRVGALYHDLGKSARPRYYIENLHPGEKSPHEEMAPDASAEAIFAHCIDGVRLAREEGLPEPIIDFMHMHHGNGLLEYFWVKNQEQGNPKQLAERDFRYPGLPPQTRETAILAICDAVEAASRTLRLPAEDKQIEHLIQRIIFGKLRLGQFDQSGLSLSDLRKIADALSNALRNSFHSRIEYQWQRDEREAPPAAPHEEVTPLPTRQRDREPTYRFRLDSLDAPRPFTPPLRAPAKPQAPEAATSEPEEPSQTAALGPERRH